MKKYAIILVIGILSFTGCAKTMFYKPGLTQNQFQKDLYVCQREAEQRFANTSSSAMRGNPFRFMITNPYVEECMITRFDYKKQ